MSQRSGVTQAQISQIESGRLNPGLATLVDLARAMDLQLVLVPRRLMPAVRSVLYPVQAHSGLSPQNGHATMSLIKRAERQINAQLALQGPSIYLDLIAEYLNYFKRAPLNAGNVMELQALAGTLAQFKHEAIPSAHLAAIANRLQRVQGRILHQSVETPRAAYDFDDDDDNA